MLNPDCHAPHSKEKGSKPLAQNNLKSSKDQTK